MVLLFKKVFITGSAGFLGSRLTEMLVTQGVVVRGYDIAIDVQDDVRNSERLARAIVEFAPDGVVHLAAMSRVEDGFLRPKECVEVNVGGITNVLETLRALPAAVRPWFVFSSSREVFGEAKKLPVTEKSPRIPMNIYGVTKFSGELLAEHYAHNYGLKTRVLRFSNAYTSVRDRLNRVVPKFILQALKGQPITVHGGNQIFDFVYLDDTVSGIIACLREVHGSAVSYNDFNLVTGKKTSIKNLVKHILALTGSVSPVTFHPARQYDVAHFWGSPAKAKKILSWKPHYSIVQGLTKAIAELRKL